MRPLLFVVKKKIEKGDAGQRLSNGFQSARDGRSSKRSARGTMIPPVNSLVRYDNPILVATSKGKKGDAPKAPAAVSQTEDILNSILPPR